MRSHIAAGCLLLIVISVAHCMDVVNKSEIRKTLAFAEPGGSHRVVVDNMFGSVDVVGYDGTDVELVAHKTVKAESNDKLKEAEEDVTIDIKQERDRIVLYVDAPWRTDHGMNYEGYHFYGYEVTVDFELKVPRKTNVYLRTVGDGDVTVKKVEGEFEVKNVNGGIDMTDIVGSGKASTVNGEVTVKFSQNPLGDCYFHTVNGSIEVTMQENLSADLRLKTFNGQVYTDYDVQALPVQAPVEREFGRRRVYRSGNSFGVRVGGGGPTLAFETLNGTINILKH